MRRALLALAVGLAALTSACERSPRPSPSWRTLEPGLEFAEFPAPERSARGDSLIRVLRFDPEQYRLTLQFASGPGAPGSRTAREWGRSDGLLATINAGMFGEDNHTAISMLKNGEHVNNPRLTDHKSVLAFEAREPTVPRVQIIDLEAQDFDSLAPAYGAFVQSIRMIALPRRNVWAQQPRRHSVAAIGIDGSGRVLFIHCRSPYSVHDLVEFLLALPLDLTNAMYAEGGPLAQLWVGAGGMDAEFIGMSDTGFLQADENLPAQPIPNVIGIARRPP